MFETNENGIPVTKIKNVTMEVKDNSNTENYDILYEVIDKLVNRNIDFSINLNYKLGYISIMTNINKESEDD